MDDLSCQNCGMTCSSFSINDRKCEICHAEICAPQNIEQVEGKIQSKIGDRVRIVIEEHPWYGEIATVCDIKNRGHTIFVRLCVLDKKVWVPNDWVEIV